MQYPSSNVMQTDQRGRLRAQGLHDAQLVSFLFEHEKKISFILVGQNKEKNELCLTMPYVVNICSLWEGSIVDSIYAWRVQEMPVELWADPDNGWNALLADRTSPINRRQEADRLKAKYPTAYLIVISCSYGGSWSALCESVSINALP